MKAVLLFGTFRPADGFRRVMAVFPEVVRQEPRALLVIAGTFKKGVSSVFKKDFLADIRAFPRKKHLVFIHQRIDPEALFRKATVLVVPYEAGESFEVLNTGVAHGLPWIASDLRGFVKLAGKMKTGIIVRNDRELVNALVKTLTPFPPLPARS